MGRKCTICSNNARNAIEKALAAKHAYATIGNKYNVGWQSVRYHERNCIVKASARVESRNAVRAALTIATPDIESHAITATRLQSRAVIVDLIEKLLEDLTGAAYCDDYALKLGIFEQLAKFTDQLAKHEGAYTRDKDNPETIARKDALDRAAKALAAKFEGALTVEEARARIESNLSIVQAERVQ